MPESKLDVFEAPALDLDNPIRDRVPKGMGGNVARLASATVSPLGFDVRGGRQSLDKALEEFQVRSPRRNNEVLSSVLRTSAN